MGIGKEIAAEVGKAGIKWGVNQGLNKIFGIGNGTKKKLKEIKEKVDKIDGKIDDLDGKVDNIQSVVFDIHETLKETNYRVEKLASNVVNMKISLEKILLESQLNTYYAEIRKKIDHINERYDLIIKKDSVEVLPTELKAPIIKEVNNIVLGGGKSIVRSLIFDVIGSFDEEKLSFPAEKIGLELLSDYLFDYKSNVVDQHNREFKYLTVKEYVEYLNSLLFQVVKALTLVNETYIVAAMKLNMSIGTIYLLHERILEETSRVISAFYSLKPAAYLFYDNVYLNESPVSGVLFNPDTQTCFGYNTSKIIIKGSGINDGLSNYTCNDDGKPLFYMTYKNEKLTNQLWTLEKNGSQIGIKTTNCSEEYYFNPTSMNVWYKEIGDDFFPTGKVKVGPSYPSLLPKKEVPQRCLYWDFVVTKESNGMNLISPDYWDSRDLPYKRSVMIFSLNPDKYIDWSSLMFKDENIRSLKIRLNYMDIGSNYYYEEYSYGKSYFDWMFIPKDLIDNSVIDISSEPYSNELTS